MGPSVIFSDLDGTLLDEAYSFDAARPALEAVRARGIALVFVTSKTAAETLRLQRLMSVDGPFVVEDGGGVYLRPDERIALGAPYEEVRLAARRLGVRGFGDMSVEEVARETGLPIEVAALAKRREFDEPFLAAPAGIEEAARALGLRVTRGGRWWHLHGDTDKGRAVRLLKERLGPARTIGLGDSPLDEPMLAETDVRVRVKRGPAEWNDRVLEFLSESRPGRRRP